MFIHEPHYTVADLANLWKLSEDTIRRLFLDEQGVIIIERRRLRKRIYRTLRIPKSVAERVYRGLRKSGAVL